MHTPQPKIYDLAETSTFGIFRGWNVRGRNVWAETSVAKMSEAKMSYIQYEYSIYIMDIWGEKSNWRMLERNVDATSLKLNLI